MSKQTFEVQYWACRPVTMPDQVRVASIKTDSPREACLECFGSFGLGYQVLPLGRKKSLIQSHRRFMEKINGDGWLSWKSKEPLPDGTPTIGLRTI